MSDFLVSLDKRYTGQALLDLIKKPYGTRAPAGQSFDFGWASIRRVMTHAEITERHLSTQRFIDNLYDSDGTADNGEWRRQR